MLLSRLNRDGALIDDNAVAIARHNLRDLAGDLFDEVEVNGAVLFRRGRNGDKNNLRVLDAFSFLFALQLTV